MEKLKFYIIDGKYVEYLSAFDKNISYNKEQSHTRPYLGIVLQIDKYKNNASFFFVYGKNKNPLSIIKFSSMIPVPNNMRVVNLLDYKKQEKKYQDLLSSEYKYINFHKKEILQIAKRMYTFVTNDK